MDNVVHDLSACSCVRLSAFRKSSLCWSFNSFNRMSGCLRDHDLSVFLDILYVRYGHYQACLPERTSRALLCAGATLIDTSDTD